jgi:excisionase family DNA binding protein
VTSRGGPDPILLTPEEAAAALRIGRTRMYALMAEGSVVSVQIGRSRRISVRALEDFVRRLHGDSEVVTRLGHDGERTPRRSRRTKPKGSSLKAELLPLPFPDNVEEQR